MKPSAVTILTRAVWMPAAREVASMDNSPVPGPTPEPERTVSQGVSLTSCQAMSGLEVRMGRVKSR